MVFNVNPWTEKSVRKLVKNRFETISVSFLFRSIWGHQESSMRGQIWRNTIFLRKCAIISGTILGMRLLEKKTIESPSAVVFCLHQCRRNWPIFSWANLGWNFHEKCWKDVWKGMQKPAAGFHQFFILHLCYLLFILFMYLYYIFTYLYYFHYPLFHSFSTICGKTDGGLMKEKACKNYQPTSLKLYWASTHAPLSGRLSTKS